MQCDLLHYLTSSPPYDGFGDPYLTMSGGKYVYNMLNSLLFSTEQNNQEIIDLTKLRDELLPLLMNGQVSVNYDLVYRADTLYM